MKEKLNKKEQHKFMDRHYICESKMWNNYIYIIDYMYTVDQVMPDR